MPQTLNLLLKSSILTKQKTLVIEPEFMEFNNINLSKFEIAAIRCGVKGIKGYKFWIGRIYCIDIKSVDGTVIKIRLKSLYGIRRKKLGEKYKLILAVLFENFVNDICQSFIAEFNNKVDLDLLGTTFTPEGIILNKIDKLIYWSDVGTKNYWHYFSIFSISDPNINASFYYLSDWNTIVLYNLVKNILMSGKSE